MTTIITYCVVSYIVTFCMLKYLNHPKSRFGWNTEEVNETFCGFVAVFAPITTPVICLVMLVVFLVKVFGSFFDFVGKTTQHRGK